ncbi:hypothetical protein P1S87_09750 [Escherichia coli]|nr:hypothetical protein [Escherichia coli]
MKKRFLSLPGILMLSLSCLPFTAGAAVVLYTTHNDALPQTDTTGGLFLGCRPG